MRVILVDSTAITINARQLSTFSFLIFAVKSSWSATWQQAVCCFLPPPQPPLGYKPHLVFHLVDDVGHYNFGFRGNKEARTPHIDSLVAQGLILERQYVFKVRALLRKVCEARNLQLWRN